MLALPTRRANLQGGMKMHNNLRLLNDSSGEQPITEGSGRPLLKTLGRGAVTEVKHRYSQIAMSVGRATRG